jgi:two-component system, NtrC family, response regulator HydG
VSDSAVSDNNLFQLLVVDDDSTIRENLKEYLANYHQAGYKLSVDQASTAEDALLKLENNTYDLLICDINLPDKDGFHVMREAMQSNPDIKKALITAYDLDTYIGMAKQEQIYNIIIKTAPFNFQELSAVVDNLLLPETSFGLEKYVQSEKPFEQIILTSSHDIMTTQEKLREFFSQFTSTDLEALSIVMVEAVTNAVYHSYRNEDGTERYQKGEVIEQLAPDEVVHVTYGADDDKLGISILDQGGNIEADDILYWLERNISGKALMDSHGRGIYLIYRLIDRLIINVHKNKSTEIILLHYLEETLQENKPIFINQIS